MDATRKHNERNHVMERLPPRPEVPGYPARDDAEVVTIMAAAAKLPRDGNEVGIVNVVRGAVRAALAFERTGDIRHLSGHAEVLLKCLRMRTHPDWVEFPPDNGPCDPADTLSVEDALAQHGL